MVVGIIELGDEGPFNTIRDEFLGLRPRPMLEWIKSQTDARYVADTVAERFVSFRQSLKPFENTDPMSSAEEILKRETEFLSMAKGRSQLVSLQDFLPKKSLAYLLRLARGERAFRRLAQGEPLKVSDLDLREGLRAMHNLVLPRIHMDVSVCGAVPPFSSGLAGKLVAGFFGHPSILDVAGQSRGTVLGQIFELGRVEPLLPLEHWP